MTEEYTLNENKPMEDAAIEIYNKFREISGTKKNVDCLQAAINFIADIIVNLSIDHNVSAKDLAKEISEDIMEAVLLKEEKLKFH
jgi:hypothetical protein